MATAVAAATHQSVANSLINRIFPVAGGPAEIALSVSAGQYFGRDFRIVGTPQWWKPVHGTYNAQQGYWIFRPDVNMCWQAENSNGPFSYWNLDGRAAGSPQDWELFVFEPAPGGSPGVVLVRNIWGAYVNFDAADAVFRCTAPRSGAELFTVDGC